MRREAVSETATKKAKCGMAPITFGSCNLIPLSISEIGLISQTLTGMEPWQSLGYRQDTLIKYFKREDPALNRYAVTVEGEAAGVLCVRHPWLMGPYVELIAIWARFQGKGIGKQIIACLEKHFETGSKNLWVTVSSFNDKARLFYQSLGFEEVGTLHDLVVRGHDEILLRKRLLERTR